MRIRVHERLFVSNSECSTRARVAAGGTRPVVVHLCGTRGRSRTRRSRSETHRADALGRRNVHCRVPRFRNHRATMYMQHLYPETPLPRDHRCPMAYLIHLENFVERIARMPMKKGLLANRPGRVKQAAGNQQRQNAIVLLRAPSPAVVGGASQIVQGAQSQRKAALGDDMRGTELSHVLEIGVSICFRSQRPGIRRFTTRRSSSITARRDSSKKSRAAPPAIRYSTPGSSVVRDDQAPREEEERFDERSRRRGSPGWTCVRLGYCWKLVNRSWREPQKRRVKTAPQARAPFMGAAASHAQNR